MSKPIFRLGRRLLEFLGFKNKISQPDIDTTQYHLRTDTNELEYKNLELLRFYISRDISRLDKKIQQSESNMLGYFLGSLVDALIVILFGDSFNDVIIWIANNFGVKATGESLIIAILKILFLILLICVFCVTAWITRKTIEYIKLKEKESGKAEYCLKEEQQETIDKFDNIACDGLLICESYIQRYTETTKSYVQDFYLYEIIHHLTKAAMIFDQIYQDKDMYVSSENAELLDTYRLNNFMDFFGEIVAFVQKAIPSDSGNRDLNKDIDNLIEYTTKWEKLQI